MNRFARFLATGGFAALVNVGLRALFSSVMIFEIAVVASYLIAMTVAFVLARLFVFEASDTSTLTQFFRFSMVNLVSLVIVWGVSVSLYRLVFPMTGFTWHAETVAHGMGVLSPAVAAYFLHKDYTFANSKMP